MEDDADDLDNLFEEYESTNEPQNEENANNNENNDTADVDTETSVRVPVPKRTVRNPRLKFDPDRLCGERGIPVVVKHFKNVKFKGKGHEKEDLNKLMSSLELWTHRLFPSMKFEDCLRQIEKLGKKRPVQTCLLKIRNDQPILRSDFVHDDEEEELEETQNETVPESPPQDAFDRLFNDGRETSQPSLISTPLNPQTSGVTLGTSFGSSLTDEQKKRMEYNKLLATERRKAKLAVMQAASLDSRDGDQEESSADVQFLDPELSRNRNATDDLRHDYLEGSSADVQFLDPEFDDNRNTTCVASKSSVIQNLDLQFADPESLVNKENQKGLNYSTKVNESEELGLDDLMDLMDEDDPPMECNGNVVPIRDNVLISDNNELLESTQSNQDMSSVKTNETANLSDTNELEKSPSIDQDMKGSPGKSIPEENEIDESLQINIKDGISYSSDNEFT